MDLSRGRRRLIRRYFHGIGILNPSGFLLKVYHIFPGSNEHFLNKSLIILKSIPIYLHQDAQYTANFQFMTEVVLFSILKKTPFMIILY